MMNRDLITSCVVLQIKGLEEVLRFTQTKEYEEFYKDLSYCLNILGGRIYISGVGKNSNIATKISESMASLGVKSGYMNPTNYLHGDAGYIEDDDSVIYITRSGKTEEIHAMARHLYSKRPHINQYLIHYNEELHQSDMPLYFLEPFTRIMYIPGIDEGDELKLAPTTSTTAFLCLLDTITVALSSELKFTKEDFLSYHPGGNLGNTLREDLNV
jgi:arabinose-5-phosphate isomerase